jgi:hypothetical protein
VNYGASQPRQIIAGVGVGAFAQRRNAKSVLAGVGVGAFAERSQASSNFEVTWTNTDDLGSEYVLQSPAFTSTTTTNTMTLYYDGALIEELGFYGSTFTLIYNGSISSMSVQCLINGQSYPDVVELFFGAGYPVQGLPSEPVLELVANSFPEVTNPQTLTIVVTATKAT